MQYSRYRGPFAKGHPQMFCDSEYEGDEVLWFLAFQQRNYSLYIHESTPKSTPRKEYQEALTDWTVHQTTRRAVSKYPRRRKQDQLILFPNSCNRSSLLDFSSRISSSSLRGPALRRALRLIRARSVALVRAHRGICRGMGVVSRNLRSFALLGFLRPPQHGRTP